ncbi:MAG: tyrosine-type recombinase/integrase, partial [Lentisphaeria bacterium]
EVQKDTSLASSTLCRRLAAIRIFYTYLHNEKVILVNPTDLMKSPKLWSNLPNHLSPSEVDILLNSFNKSDNFSIRNYTIFELMYSCGLRVSEIINLRLDQIKFEEQLLVIKESKGQKDRIVPYGSKAKTQLEKYLNTARISLQKDDTTPWCFLSKSGKKLTRQRLWNVIQTTAKLAGIKKNVHPHILRHSFATHLLFNNADLRVIQELLGHASLATTQIYTSIDTSQIKSAHKSFHPRS